MSEKKKKNSVLLKFVLEMFASVVSVVKFAELKLLVVVVDVDVSVIGHEPVKKYRVKLIAIL